VCRLPAMLADRPAAYNGGPLVSRTRHPVNARDFPLRRVPSSRFDTCATALETRPLPAVKRAHPPGARNDDQLSSGVQRRGGGRFPGLSSRSRSCIALPRSRSPVPSPDVLQCFRHATAGCVIVRRRQWGLALPNPLALTQTIQLRLRRRYILGQNQESQSRPGNCNSRPGMRFLGN